MVRKLTAALAALVLVCALPFAVHAVSTSETRASCCACCGETCACSECRCDELGCACGQGGPCACTSECCETGGCPHCNAG